MNHKKVIIFSSILLFAIIGGIIFWYNTPEQYSNKITNYEECAAAGYPILETYPEQCKLPNGKTYTRSNDDFKTSITRSGTITCLPHKNTEGPHTMECAMGIREENGKYYGISSTPYDNALNEVGRKVKVTGTFKEETRMQYTSEGIIAVTSYTFVEE